MTTPSEAKLWNLLKGNQQENRKFRRQHSVGSYVLDFYCPAERLCIELDGDSHYQEMSFSYDKARTDFLNNLKIRVLRFKNNEIYENPEWVLGEIKRSFIGRTTPTPP
jgi:very-short-patch-repair endonuclease